MVYRPLLKLVPLLLETTRACAILAIACALPLTAASAPLADDERLAKPVSLHVRMQRLDAFLAALSTECGVKLAADEPVKHESVQLQCEQAPARDVLREVAAALGYGWTEGKDAEGKPTYRLVQGVAARAAERNQRLRQRVAAAGELNTQLQLLEKYLTKYKDMSRRDAQADVAALKAAAAALPISPELWTADREWQVAQLAQEPEAPLFAAAFSAMPPADRERLFLGERLLMGTQRPDALPMPAPVLEALRIARQYRADQVSGPVERIIVPRVADEVLALDTVRGTGVLQIRLRTRRVGAVAHGPVLTLPTVMLTASRSAFGPPLAESIPGTVTADRPQDLERRVRFTWHAKLRMADDPLTYARGVLPCELLAALTAEQPGLRVAGDAYWDPIRPARYPACVPDAGVPRMESAEQSLARLSADAGKPDGLPLGTLLRELAARANVSFHVTRGGWIRCRSTLYFDLRDRNPDPALVARIFQPVVEKKVYTAEKAREAASALTFGQADQLSHPFLDFLPEFVGFRGLALSWHGWHLLAGLSTVRREELESGKPVVYGSLSPADQAAFREAVQAFSTAPGAEPVDLELGPRELPTAQVTLTPPDSPTRSLRLFTVDAARALWVGNLTAQKWK